VTQPTPTISDKVMSAFLSQHRLPATFRQVAEQYYLPLARQLPAIRGTRKQLLLGINGAQGTGKSTLADLLRVATKSMFDWRVAVLSIDDFYYTLKERRALARDVHPLLLTRGAPGTHDTDLLCDYLKRLRQLGTGEHVALPCFDKAIDDRADETRWPTVDGPVDLIILEGWCVGTTAQAGLELRQPVNELERNEDSDGTWRHYVNERLKANYQQIFAKLDFLVFIQAPDFDSILRWRVEQEEKLATVSAEGSSGLMNRAQLERFLQFYERLTRANLKALPSKADVVFRLDDAHVITSQAQKDDRH